MREGLTVRAKRLVMYFYSRNLYLQSMGCSARHFAHAVWSIGKVLPQNQANQCVKESRALLKVLKHASDDSSYFLFQICSEFDELIGAGLAVFVFPASALACPGNPYSMAV